MDQLCYMIAVQGFPLAIEPLEPLCGSFLSVGDDRLQRDRQREAAFFCA